MDEDEKMKVSEAARRLGLSVVAAGLKVGGTLDASGHGPDGSRMVTAASVEKVWGQLRREALAKVGDLTAYAASVRQRIRPPDLVGRLSSEQLDHYMTFARGRQAVSELPAEAFRIFGRPLLTWAAAPKERTHDCPFCFADGAGWGNWDGPRVFGSRAEQVLANRAPCPECPKREERFLTWKRGDARARAETRLARARFEAEQRETAEQRAQLAADKRARAVADILGREADQAMRAAYNQQFEAERVRARVARGLRP